ncbi:(4Fe-4S)-binding protein [Kamptonema cortianum]|nr:(4Fe-4S)-binding protein [Kamptonema cortianum]
MSRGKNYSNGEITVRWEPSKCIHSGICARGLPSVFRPKERPWIVIDQATSAEIIAQVEKCPSGALSIIPGDASQSND